VPVVCHRVPTAVGDAVAGPRATPAVTGPRALALLILLLVAALVPGHARIRASTPALADPRFGAVEAFRAPRQAAALHLGWERMIFWWKEMQPDGPGSWNPFATDHDRQITASLAAGRSIAGLLINTPDWAAAQPLSHAHSVPRGLYLPYDNPLNYWGHFVSQIARRYAGRIDDWIIWNEVTIPRGRAWHTWDGTVDDYAQLVKVAYLAATAANPRARIVLAGDPYFYDYGAMFSGLLRRFAADPEARSHHNYFDVVDLHLYGRPLEIATVVPWYQQALARAGLRRPIWIGETNAPPYDPAVTHRSRQVRQSSLYQQSSFIAQAFAIALAEGIERIEFNSMIDGTEFVPGSDPLGLVRNDGTARPAFAAYLTVTTLFAGVTSATYLPDPSTGVYRVILRKPGATLTVLWDQRPEPAVAHLSASEGAVLLYDKYGHARTLAPTNGHLDLPLEGASATTNPRDTRDYVIGGSPLIVSQPA